MHYLETEEDVKDTDWNCQALCVFNLVIEVFGEDAATPLLRNSTDNLGYFFY